MLFRKKMSRINLLRNERLIFSARKNRERWEEELVAKRILRHCDKKERNLTTIWDTEKRTKKNPRRLPAKSFKFERTINTHIKTRIRYEIIVLDLNWKFVFLVNRLIKKLFLINHLESDHRGSATIGDCVLPNSQLPSKGRAKGILSHPQIGACTHTHRARSLLMCSTHTDTHLRAILQNRPMLDFCRVLRFASSETAAKNCYFARR